MAESIDKTTRKSAETAAAKRAQPKRTRASIPAWRLTNVDDKKCGWLAYLLLAILTVGTLSPMLQSDLLWSEHESVERTSFPTLSSWTDAWQIDQIRNEDPFTLSTYFLESSIPLSAPVAHRLINIGLHLIAAILLLKTLEALKVPAAFSAAAVFATHPAILQTLFWPGYRNEVTATVLVLAALFFATRNRGSRDFALMFALSSLAFLIHPGAFVLPFIVALIIIHQNRLLHIEHFNRALPIFCMALFLGVWTATGSQAQRPDFAEEIKTISRIGQNLFFYLRQIFLPLDQALFHPFRAKQGYNVGASINLLPFIFFVPFYVLIFLNFRKNWARAMFLGITAFLLFVIYGLSQVGAFIDGAPAHETRLMYMALPWILSTAICGLAFATFRMDTFGRVVWKIGLSLILLIQVSLTANTAYRSSDALNLWESMSREWLASWQPVNAYLNALYDSAPETVSPEERIDILNRLLAEKPDLHQQRKRLARLFREEGQNTNALREYKHVLREAPPDNAFLEEAADYFDRLGLRWDAQKARERIEL